MSSSGPSLRTRARTSAADARVTLFTLEADATASSSASTTTATSSPRRGRAAVKAEGKEESPLTDPEEAGPPKKKRRTEKVKKEGTPRKQKPIQLALDVPHPAPPRWEEAYSLIKAQRANIVAPVDTMGCDEAGSHDPAAIAHLPPRSEKDKRLSVLISLMLSSQTKDEVTAAAVLCLRLKLGGLTVKALCDASFEDIHECINKVGFWRRKTEYIKEAAVVLRDKYDGDIPNTLEELVALKGVGPKMAFLCLSSAWGLNLGIGVDVHVHRITNRLGWHKPATNEAEQTRLNLESWLPKDKHQEINHMLVGFGQLICLPVGPRCDLCSLSSVPRLCPSKRVVSKARQASSSPRKGFSYNPKKEDPDEGEAKIVVEGQDGIGVLKTEEGEVAIEGETVKTPQGVDAEERRSFIKAEPQADQAEVETEAVISTLREGASKDLSW